MGTGPIEWRNRKSRIRRYRQTERQFPVVQFPYSALSRLRLYYNFHIQSQTGLDNDPLRVSFSKGILGKSLGAVLRIIYASCVDLRPCLLYTSPSPRD